MAQTDRKEKFARTYRELFDTIERGADQCSTDRLQILLEERKEQLKAGLEAFASPSAQSRSKITSGSSVTVDGNTIKLDQNEKDLIVKLSELTDLNELSCASLWDNYRTTNKDIVARYKQAMEDQPPTALHENIQLLMNMINLYYEDRIALLECITSLKRIAMNGDHPYASIASEFISKFYTDSSATAFTERLFAQYAKLVRTAVPNQMYAYPGWPLVWAKQNLREQKALLEIVFLFTAAEPVAPNFALKVIQEYEADCFANHQAFGYILDDEGAALRDKVSNLSMLLSINTIISPTLTTDTPLDSSKSGKTLIDSPEIVSKINQIAVYLGDQVEHSVFLLAWSFLLTCVGCAINGEQSNAQPPSTYTQVQDVLAGKQTITTDYLIDRPSVSRCDVDHTKRTIHIQQHSNMEPVYIGRALKLGVFNVISRILSSETCSEEDVNSFGYRTVIQRLLNCFLSVTRPLFLPSDCYEDLISAYCLLYKNQPTLCNTFWTEYFDESNPFTLLAAARGRFPVLFPDFIRLLSALAGTPDEERTEFSKVAASRVFKYLCHLPTLSVQLKPSVDVRENTEDGVSTIYTNQPVRVTYESDLIGALVIPRNCSGRLMNKSAEDRIVQFSLPYSGWHLLTSVLSGFVTDYKHNTIDIQDDSNVMSGKDLDIINSIVDLIYNVLSSDSTLVSELTEHIDTVTGNTNNATSTLISILCSILTSCSSFDKCPITTMTLTLKCLTLLLPSHSDFIWAYLKFAPFLPTTNMSYPLQFVQPAIATRAAQIQGIVFKYECTVGRYSLLLSFLDFVKQLVADIQHRWWSNGDIQKNPASTSQYKVEILYICLHYLMSDVFPSYAHWRYQKISERFLIGTKILSIFTDIATNFKDSVTTGAKLSLSSIRESIFSNFLYDGGVYHISPLVDTISDGANTANTLYNSNHPKEAQRIEKLTEMTFQFVKLLLQYRLQQIQAGQTVADSTLERLLLERTVGKFSSDFLLRVARHIHYRHNISLPIQATNVLSILCRTTATWKSSPNFVQYLGSTEQVHSIIRTYLSFAKDPSQNETLLASIWQLLTILLETQPSLAILFLDCGDLIMPSPKSAVKLLSGQSQPAAANNASSTDSAIRAAVDILSHWETISVEKPAVMSNALRFLATFWKTAFDHYALVERHRTDSALWDILGKVLLNPSTDATGMDKEAQNLLGENDSGNRFDMEARRLCCLNLSKAYAMRIMAYEIHLTASNVHRQTEDISKRLPAGLQNLLTKVCEPAKLASLRDAFVKNDFQSATVRAAESSAEILLQTIGVDDSSLLLRKIPRSGDGDDVSGGEAREYGDNYLYDYRLSSSRVCSLVKDINVKYNFDVHNVIVTPEVQAVLDLKQYANQFLKSVLLVNHNSSIVDSQVILLRSFKTFIETASHHTSELMWPARAATPSSAALYMFLKDLLVKAQNETRDDGVTLTSYHILLELIRNLVEKWISLNHAVVVAGDSTAQQTEYKQKTFDILSSLSGLLERENYALFNSICDRTAVRFHQPLLESIMLCLRTLSGIDRAAPLSDSRMQLETCLTTILQVACSSFHVLVIKANSFSAEGSSVSESVVENVVKDITVVVSLLQELISPKYKLAQEVWIEIFEKANTIPSLISLFAGGAQLIVKEIDGQYSGATNGVYNINITPYAETALYLLLALSNIPKAADKLIKHNIFAILCNNSLSPRLQQGQLDIFIRFGERNKNGPAHVERNPAHIVWSQILGVVNNLMRTIGNSEVVLRDTVNFLQMYGPQIATAFNNANGANDSIFGLTASESLSSCLLEEIERINMIFFSLSKYLERLPNIANNLFVAFKDCSLFLLQRYHYFFTHPSHMQAQLHPINNMERQQLQTFVAPDTSKDDNSSTTTAKTNTADPSVTPTTETKPQISQLMLKILRLTMTISHYMLSTLIVLTNTDVILSANIVDWPFGNTIISPGVRVTVGESASFGTLMECMNISTTMIHQWHGVKEFPTDMILNFVQDCAILLITQAVLWVAKPGISHDNRLALAQENVPDIADTLNKTMIALSKLDKEKVGSSVAVVSKLKLMRFLQQYLGERYFEN